MHPLAGAVWRQPQTDGAATCDCLPSFPPKHLEGGTKQQDRGLRAYLLPAVASCTHRCPPVVISQPGEISIDPSQQPGGPALLLQPLPSTIHLSG